MMKGVHKFGCCPGVCKLGVRVRTFPRPELDRPSRRDHKRFLPKLNLSARQVLRKQFRLGIGSPGYFRLFSKRLAHWDQFGPQTNGSRMVFSKVSVKL